MIFNAEFNADLKFIKVNLFKKNHTVPKLLNNSVKCLKQ